MSRPAVGAVVPREVPPEGVVARARAAEAAGLDELWVVEDCFWSGGVAQAAAVLAATERIPVGIGILPVPLRNPALAAMELATLARLHPGRLHAGFGHGVESWMRQVGARPRDRLVALEETLEAVRALLRGEQVTRAGRHVHLDGVALEFPPAEPPLVSAGALGPRSLEIAGRAADGVVIAEPSAPAFVRWARERVGAPGARVTVYAWFCLDDDPARAREALRPSLRGWLERPERALQRDVLDVDDADLAALSDHVVDLLVVAGDAAGCAARLRALGDAGADAVALFPLPGREDEQLRRLGAEVLPHL